MENNDFITKYELSGSLKQYFIELYEKAIVCK